MVPVRQGDVIEVLETDPSGWTFAKNLTNGTSATGWVPTWIVPAPGSLEPAQRPAKVPEVAPQPALPMHHGQPHQVHPAQQVQHAQPAQQVHPHQPLQVQPREAPQRQAAQPRPMDRPQAAATLARAAQAFTSGSDSQMSLRPEDVVEVVERHPSGWTFGRKMDPDSATAVAEGWFPDWVCNPKP